jgi:hypothetical protein
MIAFSDLLVPLTTDQVRANLVQILVGLGVPADQWRKGGVFSTILTSFAMIFSMFTNLFAQAIGSGFLTTAKGGWLTWVAFYMYGVTRPAASFASGNLTLVNSGGAILSYTAGQLIFGNASTGKQYVNTGTVSLGAGATGTFPIAASVAGSASSAAPGQITVFVTPVLGVTCTNPATVAGSDAMSDADLVLLCLDRLQSLSPGGAPGAYRFAVRTALNAGVPVNINRVTVVLDTSTGKVGVYAASPSGSPSASDIVAANDNVAAIATPDGITANVFAAAILAYSSQLTVYAEALPGVAAVDVLTAIQAALVAFFSTYNVGGLPKNAGNGLWSSTIDGVVKNAHPAIYAVDGATDLLMSVGTVAVDTMPTPVVILEAA